MMGNMVTYGVAEASLVGSHPLLPGFAVYAVKPWPKEYWRSPEDEKPNLIDLDLEFIEKNTWLTEQEAVDHLNNQFNQSK